jgi:hypothetical protein
MGDHSKFYDNLSQVLDYWITDIHEVTDMSNWKSTLSDKGINEMVIDLADVMRQEVDLAKYTPVIKAVQMNEAFINAEFIVSHS